MSQKNTLITYLYRDGDNYKRAGEIIFTNPEALDLATIKARLAASMLDECNFIAGQIGVPEVFLYPTFKVNDADHCWHEVMEAEETTSPASDPRTISAFIMEVESAAREGWREFDPLLEQTPEELLAAL